jgi:ATP-binding cassette subfamily B protein/subfamily B ATP-binding cassette protein MsbA
VSTFLRLLDLIRGRRLMLAAGIACALGYTLLSLVPPLLIRRVIQQIVAAGGSGADAETAGWIGLAALAIVAVALLRGLCRYGDALVSHVVAYRILDELLVRVYAHLQRMPHCFFADQRTGALATRAVSDVEAIEVFIAHAIGQAVQAVLVPGAMIAVLLLINPWLALLTLLPLPLVAWLVLWFRPRTHAAWRRVRRQLADLGATFHEDVGGVAIVKSFARERERRAALAGQSRRFADQIIRANAWTLIPPASIEAVAGVGAALVVWQGGLAGLHGQLSAADLFVFVVYLGHIYQPLLQLSALGEGLNSALAAGERVFELLDAEPEIVDRPGAAAPARFDESVRFEAVWFGYDPARPVLRGLDLRLEPGETVALVGQTGAGKTTTISLVPRFYDVQGGTVLVGGHDVRALPLGYLRERVAMVLQDVFLFHGSIRDNLLFGRLDATEPELRAAARAAHAEEFIREMPEGYETLVGERGVRLSGGQKQRLSIARALLKDAPILILDEATSSVDVETEALIQDALARLTRGRTTLVIAHRLSTIRQADRIAVLSGGAVAELGRHEELVGRGGIYSQLYRVKVEPGSWSLV